MKSILQNEKKCFVCKSQINIHEHHIYFGGNRTQSEKHGFKCFLCLEHHTGTYGVHGKYGHDLDLALKQTCQQEFEKLHTREEFMKIIGRSYL